MPIKVQCKRAVVDPETDQRRPCGNAFKVSDSLAGKVIRCPKCKQGIQVPDPSRPVTKKAKQPTAAIQSMDPLADKQNVMDQETTTGSRNYRKMAVCTECGKPVSGDVCRACGHKKNRPKNESVDKIKPQVCGMQLWLCRTIRQALPVKVMVLVMHASILAIVLLVGGSTVVGMTTQNVSVLAGLFLLFVVATISLVYLAFAFKGYQFVMQPGAQLAWFQKPFWNLILGLARSKNWRDYDARLSKRIVVTADDPGLTDADIFDLPDIRRANVVDLENTQVTDAGLKSLYQLTNLQCLVVRNTQVTAAEVYRFQQAFPATWIWS